VAVTLDLSPADLVVSQPSTFGDSTINFNWTTFLQLLYFLDQQNSITTTIQPPMTGIGIT